MDLRQRVYSVLIVSASARVCEALKELLPAERFEPVRTEHSIGAARRAAAERTYDLVVLTSPLPDDPGVGFAVDLCASDSTAVMLLVQRELHDEIHDRVCAHGVFTLPRPTTAEFAATAFGWMVSMRERMRKFEKKTLSIEEKMEEIRLVNHAKWVLIREMQMEEGEAHRYIEKQAMDRCISKRELAQELIRLYE